jgi:hypothetical protein
MHLERHHVKITFPLVLYIGIFCSVLNAASEEPDPEYLQKNGLVYVEPENVVQKIKNEEYSLLPYRERRPRWGFVIEAGYCTYEPTHLEPNFSQKTYKEVYGTPAMGMLELNFTFKRNFSAGSLAAELSGGNLQNSNSDSAFVGSNITMTPIAFGGGFYMDNIWSEPYFVPFVTGGLYTMIYKESLGGNSVHGNTSVAPYVNGGFAIQLDWIDKHHARVSYQDSGIQSSYIYVEGRKYFSSSSKKDPDFSNDIALAAGFRVEF